MGGMQALLRPVFPSPTTLKYNMHIDPHRRYFLGHFRLPRCTYEYSYIALGQRRLRSLKAGRLDTALGLPRTPRYREHPLRAPIPRTHPTHAVQDEASGWTKQRLFISS